MYEKSKQEYKFKINQAKKDDTAKLVGNSNNKQKTVWEIINKETGRKRNTKYNTESKLTAEEFNNYFVNIGQKVAMSVGRSQKTHRDYLRKKNINNVKSMFLKQTTEEEIKDIINKLKAKHSKDIYGLNTIILKKISNEIVEPLTVIMNKCIAEGVFPRKLKRAKIIPIHKKGSEEEEQNYRPIAVLPVFSKVLETLLKKRLMSYFEKNELLSPSQNGYRKGRSTTTALLSLVEKVSLAFDNKLMAAVSMCDLSKAFDTVPTNALLNKLHFYGVRGVPNQLLESYLQGRTQMVKWKNFESSEQYVKWGVPQGSILGPILFIIYLDDLHDNVISDGGLSYADDTSFLTIGCTEAEVEQKSNNTLKQSADWFGSNGLKLNADKTQQLLFTTSLQNKIKSIDFLGIKIDTRLTWHDHIHHLSKKLSSALFCIRTIRKISTYQAARMTYFAYFHSLLSYGILLWGLSSETEILLKLQKRALRILANLEPRDSCREVFKEHNILTLPSTYILTCSKYIYENKCDNKFAPNGSCHSYSTRARNIIKIPYHRLKTTQHNSSYMAVKIYNHIPQYVKVLPQRTFEGEVRRFLTTHSFYSVQEFFNTEWK